MARFRFLAHVTAAVLMLLSTALAQDAPKDSLSDIKDGVAALSPIAAIAESRLDKPAGLARWQGAWWAINGARGDNTLWRADAPDFKDARPMPVEGATANRWEALAVLGDDLLVCDTGNPRRATEALKAWRVRHEEGRLRVVAAYTLSQPDKPIDAEAAFTMAGTLHLVTRARGDERTAIWRYPELSADQPNKPEFVCNLNATGHCVVTGADCDGKHVVLLAQTRLLTLPADKLDAMPDSVRFYAGACKACALHEGQLVVLSGTDVYAINNFAARGLRSAMPAMPAVELPLEDGKYEPDGTGEAWKGGAYALPLKGISEAEHVRWMIGGAHLMLAGKLRYDGAFTSSSEQGSRLGAGLALMIGSGDDDYLTGGEKIFWLGDNGLTGLDAWLLDPAGMKLAPLKGVAVAGEVKEGWLTFEYAIPLTALFGEGKLPDAFRANLWGFNLRKSEPRLTGANFGCINHPYTWARTRIVVR
ncbi:MAG: hypothetical protein KF696_11840 [Planctomycetes bacterium]|nr:hypothetical protein [Planctomycetota bacterium]MCW8136979.1 hypothetical protein [Planctomycetota bacterium]